MKFKIYVEDGVTQVKSKVFEADSLEDAEYQADSDTWTVDNGWELENENTLCERRDELTEELA